MRAVHLMAGAGVAEDGGVAADITEVLHDRAVTFLRAQVRKERRRAARREVAADDPVAQAGHEGRLLALELVGALTPEEVGSWRQRLREAAEWREPRDGSLANEVRERAVGHLEALIAPLSPSTPEASAACSSAIAAYAKTGVLTADQALAWRERLRAQIGLDQERPPRCSGRELLRVIPGPAERVRNRRVTAAELYADGVILRWHHARRWPDGPETPRIWNDIDRATEGVGGPEPHALTDDLGTPYFGCGSGAGLGINGGGWIVTFGASGFTPAVPDAARRLQVALWDRDIDIEL